MLEDVEFVFVRSIDELLNVVFRDLTDTPRPSKRAKKSGKNTRSKAARKAVKRKQKKATVRRKKKR